ncbi:MAG TPA: hypothetical protein VIM86_08165 [Thermodesulfobacteriota bacterium]
MPHGRARRLVVGLLVLAALLLVVVRIARPGGRGPRRLLLGPAAQGLSGVRRRTSPPGGDSPGRPRSPPPR